MTLFKTMRPPFLVLAPVSLLPGFAVVYTSQHPFEASLAGLILVAALCAHISVNMLNEYQDYRSGLDAMTRRTPFNGGSGALVADPGQANTVFAVSMLMLAVTVAIGLYFIARTGPVLLPVGVVGVAIVLSYTRWLNRSALLCLVAPGLAFGPLMVCGTEAAMTGSYSMTALLASLPQFFIINNLLLMNQIPDSEADARAGRRHLAIRYGPKRSLDVHAVFVAGSMAAAVAGCAAGLLPQAVCLFVAPVAAAGLYVNVSARRALRAGRGLLREQGLSVILALTIPVAVAAGLLEPVVKW